MQCAEDTSRLPIVTTDLVPGHGPLNDQTKLFCQHYMGEHRLDPAAALTAAGFDHQDPGTYARRLLTKDVVQAYLRELVAESDFGIELSPRAVWDATVARAIFDPLKTQMVDAEGYIQIKSLSDMPLNVRQCIKTQAIKEKTHKDGTVERTVIYEFYDAQKASELIGRWSGMDNQRDPLMANREPEPVWAGIIVEGLPAERTEDRNDKPTNEQRAEQARQVRALSSFEPGDQVIEIGGDSTGQSQSYDRGGTFED